MKRSMDEKFNHFNKKIVFISSLIPEKMCSEVHKKMKTGMPDAAIALQRHLLEGLFYNIHTDISLINVLPISSYPNNYEDLFIKHEKFTTEFSSENINVGFLNLKGVRRKSIERNVYKALCTEFSNNDEGILFVYTLSSSFLKAVKKFKKIKSKVHVCVVVADLPSMNDLSQNTDIFNKISNKILAKKSYKNMTAIDSFVLLTEQMAEYLKISCPYCVVEGIATIPSEYSIKCSQVTDQIKNVLYTGTLHKKFGILNLIEAFMKTMDCNYRLQICGIGDSINEIYQASKKDNRICFIGKVDRETVLKLQKEATVLVNPRQNNEVFTKYSFPSKNLEYLSSGTPVIAYMLDGIPIEYSEYIISPKDNSIQALTAAIDNICQLTNLERRQIGEKGKQFVLNEKNAKCQTKKIVDMINSIMEEKND